MKITQIINNVIFFKFVPLSWLTNDLASRHICMQHTQRIKPHAFGVRLMKITAMSTKVKCRAPISYEIKYFITKSAVKVKQFYFFVESLAQLYFATFFAIHVIFFLQLNLQCYLMGFNAFNMYQFTTKVKFIGFR